MEVIERTVQYNYRNIENFGWTNINYGDNMYLVLLSLHICYLNLFNKHKNMNKDIHTKNYYVKFENVVGFFKIFLQTIYNRFYILHGTILSRLLGKV